VYDHPHDFRGRDERPPAACRIVDALAFPGIEDVHHQPHDRARGVKLARLLVRQIRKLLDQVFVGLAENVGLRRLVAERDSRKTFDEIAEQGVGQALLVGPRRIAEDAVKRFRIRFFDAAYGLLQRLTDIGCNHTNVAPVAAFGNLKPVVLGELCVFLVIARFRQRRRIFLIMDIGDAFKKKQREYIGFEVGGIHRTAQDVGGFPEEGFELTEGGDVVIYDHPLSLWYDPPIQLGERGGGDKNRFIFLISPGVDVVKGICVQAICHELHDVAHDGASIFEPSSFFHAGTALNCN
jgi:hypothetical protein